MSEMVRGDFFQGLNKISNYFDDIVKNIAELGDDDLIMLYQYLSTIGQSAWKAQCAVIFEAKSRRVKIEDIAGEIGVSRAQAYRDIQIYEKFLKDDLFSIEDKTFYQIALSAPDPVAALAHADERKQEISAYSTREFSRYVKSLLGVTQNSRGGEVNYFIFPSHRDADYLDFVRSLPCCVTRAMPSEPHHIETGGAGMKCSDYLVIPLSRAVHRELTAVGGGKDLLIEKYNIDPHRVALRCLIEYVRSVL